MNRVSTLLSQGLAARGYSQKGADEWCKESCDGFCLYWVQLRTSRTATEDWLELSVGITAPAIDALVSTLMPSLSSQPMGLLGFDLAHLVRGPKESGWSYPKNRIDDVAIADLLGFFDASAVPLIERIGSKRGLVEFGLRRARGDLSDPVVCNEPMVVPSILLLLSDRTTALAATQQYLNQVGPDGAPLRVKFLKRVLEQYEE